MDKKIKERWVKALRSGKFQQGEGFLCQVNSDGKREYCCLGVLSQLAVRSGVIGTPQEASQINADDGKVFAFHGKVHFVPMRVADWAALGERDPVIGETTLSTLNDGGASPETPKQSFEEIADLIERHL